MSKELRRPSSRTSGTSLRPRVSFNRDVHIKRYGSKKLPTVEEEEDMKSRGRADGTDFARYEEASRRTEKQTLVNRIKSFFQKNKNNDDPVKSRYKEYKGESYDRERRRDSAPDSKNAWFRSLDRNGKGGVRYFGESDQETSTSRRSGLGVRPRNNKYNWDSTDDATTDAEPGRYDSLVYLHAPQVRDIPSRNSKPAKRHLTRSVSLVGPWTPMHKPSRTSTDSATQTLTRERKDRKLRDLVFTGPSIESTREWRGRI